MRRFSSLFAVAVALTLPAVARANDHYLQGSIGQSYGIDIGSTHADIVGAVTSLEDGLWPAMAANQGDVQAIGDTRILHNMLQGPANVSNSGEAQGIATFPYGVQGIDVWSATASVGYRQDFWSLYYAGGFVGTHSTQMGAGVYPFETLGLMGLGFAEAVLAPFSGERSLSLADPYMGSAAHYILGVAGHHGGGSLRLGYLGNEQAGLMASLAYEPWSLSATMAIDASSGDVPYVRIGMVRSAAPWRAAFGDDVGECDPDDHCIVAPLASVYARGYLLSVPEPGFYQPSSAPQSTGLWTIHLEQLNIPLPLGYIDARLAFGVAPAWWLHDLSLGWHSATFNGGNTLKAGWPPIDFGLVVGYAQMPTLAYAGNSGDGLFTFTLEARWGDWLRGGLRYNNPEALALYPFASGSTEVFITVTQEAFFHD